MMLNLFINSRILWVRSISSRTTAFIKRWTIGTSNCVISHFPGPFHFAPGGTFSTLWQFEKERNVPGRCGMFFSRRTPSPRLAQYTVERGRGDRGQTFLKSFYKRGKIVTIYSRRLSFKNEDTRSSECG